MNRKLSCNVNFLVRILSSNSYRYSLKIHNNKFCPCGFTNTTRRLKHSTEWQAVASFTIVGIFKSAIFIMKIYFIVVKKLLYLNIFYLKSYSKTFISNSLSYGLVRRSHGRNQRCIRKYFANIFVEFHVITSITNAYVARENNSIYHDIGTFCCSQ
jgi:hypothetical protein